MKGLIKYRFLTLYFPGAFPTMSKIVCKLFLNQFKLQKFIKINLYMIKYINELLKPVCNYWQYAVIP